MKKLDGVYPDDIFENESDIGVRFDSNERILEISDLHDVSEEARMFKLHVIIDNDGIDIAL